VHLSFQADIAFDLCPLIYLTAPKHTAKATKSCRKGWSKGCRKRAETAKPPQQDQQRSQLEDDVWTIVTYSN
jgi:hypothetical protein